MRPDISVVGINVVGRNSKKKTGKVWTNNEENRNQGLSKSIAPRNVKGRMIYAIH